MAKKLHQGTVETLKNGVAGVRARSTGSNPSFLVNLKVPVSVKLKAPVEFEYDASLKTKENSARFVRALKG